jgi:rare lipoprotein A
MILRYRLVFIGFFREFIMRIISRIALGLIAATLSLHASLAAAQSFDDRWSIIPKAHAEPAPGGDQPNRPPPQSSSPVASQPAPGADNRPVRQSFSVKASFYSYSKGKTASGATFDRNSATAAHRTLPFGTRLAVTDPRSKRVVTVTVNDRGPFTKGRVLDLSYAAAEALQMTGRGVMKVTAAVE